MRPLSASNGLLLIAHKTHTDVIYFQSEEDNIQPCALVPVLEPALSAKEPSPPREGRSPSPDTLLLTHSGPNVPPGTTTIQSEQRSRLAAELSKST